LKNGQKIKVLADSGCYSIVVRSLERGLPNSAKTSKPAANHTGKTGEKGNLRRLRQICRLTSFFCDIWVGKIDKF